MYTNQHLTTRQIGAAVGMNHVKVWRILIRMGIKSSYGERVDVTCSRCGKGYSLTRARWRKARKTYCSQACYMAAIHNPDYVQSRNGQRIARKVVSGHFQLREGNVIHHMDSNDTHNEKENLWVFATQADHMAWHRGWKEIQPLWKGDEDGHRQKGRL